MSGNGTMYLSVSVFTVSSTSFCQQLGQYLEITDEKITNAGRKRKEEISAPWITYSFAVRPESDGENNTYPRYDH